MPWGLSSKLKDMHPTKSNDGPILWMRPGEQVYSLTPSFFISPYEFKFRCIKSDLLSSPSRWGWHHTCELAFENHEFEVEFLLQCNVDNFISVHCILQGCNKLVPCFLFGLKETSSMWKTTNRSDLLRTQCISDYTSGAFSHRWSPLKSWASLPWSVAGPASMSCKTWSTFPDPPWNVSC